MKKRVIKSRGGYTLVELIVTFALTALLMGAIAALIPTYMDVYARTRDVAEAQNLAKTLNETILAELSTAQKSYIEDGGAGSICSVLISSATDAGGNFNTVKYRNKSGYLMDIYADAEGKLVLHYHKSVDERGIEVSPEVFWGYEEGVYGTNRITRLLFSREGDGLVKVELTLGNVNTGYEFSTADIIKCYNLQLPTDIEAK